MKDLKVGKKLLIGFGFAVAVAFFLIILSLGQLGSINEIVQDLKNDKFPKTIWANDIIDAGNLTGQHLRESALSTDIAFRERELSKISEFSNTILDRYNKLDSNSKSGTEGKSILAKFTSVQNSIYLPALNKTIALIRADKIEEASEFIINEFTPAQDALVAAITDVIKYQNKMVDAAAMDAENTNNSAFNFLLLIGVLAGAVLIAAGVYITKGIVNPLNTVVDRVKQLQSNCLTNLGSGLTGMSKGDLTAKIEKSTKPLEMTHKDEIGELARTIDEMIYKTQSGIDAYETVRDKIFGLTSETNKLISDSKNGLLDNRGDASKFEGTYKELVNGINEMMDAVILPLQDGTQALEHMATGDLTVRVKAEYKGQHRKLKDSINKLGDSLEQVISDVTSAVQATASASTQISSSSEEMAAGAQEQSTQASEVASAVEQMTATILQTSKNSTGALDNAKKAGDVAKKGGSVVKETVGGMIRIAEVVKAAAMTVQKLGANSDQIGEIIQVIDDIADQTNLLALNAAIEAARAGEHGRGFAVVADEVRKLAERTTKATKEIADMIKQIQNDTQGAVKSINEGTEEVDKGKELANRAGESLTQIIESSDKVMDDISQVATASEEQSSTAEQISKSIEGISSVTQQSAAGTQQIARAAEDLNRLT
ncbi:MAG: MCP four helix bundle domain-containing protein, partial [Melioribacteraceae bacterium]|nr:MCP four helix bundle domain-containing protein [Melioribacteraceae bacterium]